MSVSHRKSFNFKSIYNPKRLSLSTRLEIMRKKRLVRLAKKLLADGMHTPRPDTYDNTDECVNLKDLSFLLKGDCVSDSEGSSLYDSDDFETETDETKVDVQNDVNDGAQVDENDDTQVDENDDTQVDKHDDTQVDEHDDTQVDEHDDTQVDVKKEVKKEINHLTTTKDNSAPKDENKTLLLVEEEAEIVEANEI